MSNMIPLDGSAKLPSYLLKNKDNPAFKAVNADIFTGGPQFPFLSIKGKTWTVVKNGEKKLLTTVVEGEEVPKASIKVVAIRANPNSRTYYSGAYDPESSEGTRPTCYTHDGVAPAADAVEPQSKKCAICPHAAKGSKVSADGKESAFKGSACSRNTRLAVLDPDMPDVRMLLRLPPASRWEFGEQVKQLDNRGIPYNAAVMHVKFDPAEASPKLLFKTVGLVDDKLYETITALYDGDEIKDIVGLSPIERPESAPTLALKHEELDAVITAQVTVQKAQEATKAPAKPKAKEKPQEVENLDNSLLSDLDKLLGSGTDD
jgi:hypothetical protein